MYLILYKSESWKSFSKEAAGCQKREKLANQPPSRDCQARFVFKISLVVGIVLSNMPFLLLLPGSRHSRIRRRPPAPQEGVREVPAVYIGTSCSRRPSLIDICLSRSPVSVYFLQPRLVHNRYLQWSLIALFTCHYLPNFVSSRIVLQRLHCPIWSISAPFVSNVVA